MDVLIDDKYSKEQIHINDYKIFSKSYINGDPTVLFEAGMGDSSEIWNYIQNDEPELIVEAIVEIVNKYRS
ncbi:hypothetical protein [Tissierella praeacuta]|uniref:hypothetical protein n=1 Tax=Tissierella praeacuta TaxID=43131 RepID=UPI00333F7E4E